MSAAALPTGTVTFLFTDIEGSTRMLRALGDRYGEVLDRHRAILREAIESNGGHVFGSEGDALFAVFERPVAALAAAIAGQRALAAAEWPSGAELRVRIGLHTGDATLVGEDYVGLALHEAARIAAAAHGRQIITSEITRQLVGDSPPAGVELHDLGPHRLKDLPRALHLYQVVAPGLVREFPALRALGGRPNNLPPQLTTFIGRAELGPARGLLRNARLLTLTGPGGTGKTRMALELAAGAADRFPDGVFFVPLETVTDPEQVAPAIVSALNLANAGGDRSPDERLLDHLRDREMLLVLDNLEQLIEAAPIVARLLREAPAVRIIATSRVPLRIGGEQEFGVPPLTTPQTDGALTAAEAARSEAVRLFAERAMAVQPAFQLSDDNAGDVAEIVRRLDGLPLAIELAAARTRILPIPALRARLDDRLGVLVGGGRDLPARQQTLRGAIDWSHDLLEPADRTLFARLAVFAGGAWLAQIEAVCGTPDIDVLGGVSSLVEKSLVRGVMTDEAEPRFAMLPTIREYGLEKLVASGEAEELRRRHAEAYVAALERCAAALTGAHSRELLDHLEPDHENLRTALDWAIDSGETQIALRLVAAVWRYWQIRGHLHEAQQRIDRLFAMPRIDEAPDELRIRARIAAGGVAYWRSDQHTMRTHYDAALGLARRFGDPALLAEALYSWGFIGSFAEEIDPDELSASLAAWDEAAQLYRSLGDRTGAANVVWARAIATFMRPDYAAARRGFSEALELYRAIDDRFGVGWSLYMMAASEFMDGHNSETVERLREALDVFVGTGDRSGIAFSAALVGLVALREDRPEIGWRLLGGVETLRRAAGIDLVEAPAQPGELRFPEPPSPDQTVAWHAWQEGTHVSEDELVVGALAYRVRAERPTAPALPGQPGPRDQPDPPGR